MKVWKRKKLLGKYGKIQEIVEKELSCSAHDMNHVMRVYNLALKIAKKEKNINLDILKISTLLHDIGRVKEDDDKTGKVCHAEESARMCVPILKKFNYSDKNIKDIKHCILTHRYKTNNKPRTIEAKVLFDADKLDSLGAIFIIKGGMWMGRNGCEIFPRTSFKKYMKENLDGGRENGRIKDSSKHNMFYEVEFKNKKLPNLMFTKTGIKIAKERLKFNLIFIDRLQKEAEGLL